MRVFVALAALFLAVAAHPNISFVIAEHLLAEEMSEASIPGVSYAIVEGDGITVGHRGVEELGEDRPVTDETAFLIGSLSKSFTALAIMQLVEAGEMELDAPMSDYLDAFRSGSRTGKTTIRQLLSHTSGYSTFQGNGWQAETGVETQALARRTRAIAAITPATEPGERWEYSNINYMLLGRIIEVTSGLSFADYMTARIFEPLGMTDSFVPTSEGNDRLASGHTPWFTGKRVLERTPSDLAGAPAGGIASTAGDMARYLQAMMNGQDDVLSAAGKERMMQPASAVSPHYGFGWFLNPQTGVVGHSGSNPGYESLATLVPAQRKAALTLTNAGSGFAFGNGYDMQYGFADRALGIEENPGLPGPWALPLYLYLILSPLLYLGAIGWAFFRSAAIRSKRGSKAGLFSLWFPLLATAVQAAILMLLLPRIFGAPLDAIGAFQPDVWWALLATAASGLLWAVVRLVVAYGSGNTRGPIAEGS